MTQITQMPAGAPGARRQALRACPFCEETERLDIAEARFERPIVCNGDTLKDGAGAEIMEAVPGVSCQVCEAMAPLDVWNGLRPVSDFAVLRDFDPPGEARN